MNQRIVDDITNFIFVEDEPSHADIIFIPGCSYPQLGEEAAALYRQGLAKYVMPSGRVSIKTGKFDGVKSKQEVYGKDYQSECEFLADVLQINGVPEQAILWEDKSEYTQQNAQFSRAVADKHGLVIRKAILCCKRYHARRALMYYQMAFPEAAFMVHPITSEKEGEDIAAENWYKTAPGVRKVLGEMQRVGQQFLEGFLQEVGQ